jgi:hypothetical protein
MMKQHFHIEMEEKDSYSMNKSGVLQNVKTVEMEWQYLAEM